MKIGLKGPGGAAEQADDEETKHHRHPNPLAASSLFPQILASVVYKLSVQYSGVCPRYVRQAFDSRRGSGEGREEGHRRQKLKKKEEIS